MKKRLCVLCGLREASKKGDHLPPQGIYPKESRKPNQELHKVPACAKCNNSAGKYDEEFKIIIGLTTGEFREDQDSIIDSMGKTIGFNKRIARQVFSTKRNTYVDRGRGVAEPVAAVTFKPVAYRKVIQRMVKGLYWRETGEILKPKSRITVYPTHEITYTQAAAFQRLMNELKANKLNNDTFVYKVHIDEGGGSFWGMQFFEKHTVFAYAE